MVKRPPLLLLYLERVVMLFKRKTHTWDWVDSDTGIILDRVPAEYVSYIYNIIYKALRTGRRAVMPDALEEETLLVLKELINANELRLAPNMQMRMMSNWTEFKGGSRKTPKVSIPEYDCMRFNNGQGRKKQSGKSIGYERVPMEIVYEDNPKDTGFLCACGVASFNEQTALEHVWNCPTGLSRGPRLTIIRKTIGA